MAVDFVLRWLLYMRLLQDQLPDMLSHMMQLYNGMVASIANRSRFSVVAVVQSKCYL